MADPSDHVFPAQKFRWIHDQLLRDRFAAADDFVRPQPAGDDDILLVHDPGWVTRLKSGTLGFHEILRLEIPYSQKMVQAFWLAAGGTILASRLALEEEERAAVHGEGVAARRGVDHHDPEGDERDRRAHEHALGERHRPVPAPPAG